MDEEKLGLEKSRELAHCVPNEPDWRLAVGNSYNLSEVDLRAKSQPVACWRGTRIRVLILLGLLPLAERGDLSTRDRWNGIMECDCSLSQSLRRGAAMQWRVGKQANGNASGAEREGERATGTTNRRRIAPIAAVQCASRLWSRI